VVTRGHALVVRRAALAILEGWVEGLELRAGVGAPRWLCVELEVLRMAVKRLAG
jgi:hypothetical protein